MQIINLIKNYLKQNLYSLKTKYSKINYKLDLIDKKLERYLLKISIIDKYFNYFFVVFFIIFYLIFKHYFVYGMGWDDGRFYIFYPSRYYDVISDNKRFSTLEQENNNSFYTNTLFIFSILEKIGFKYQDFYFLIFFLGFYFFYSSLIEIKGYYNLDYPLSKYFIFFLSLIYPSNPLVLDQTWSNHYLSIFTIIGTPLVFLYFLKVLFMKIKIIDIILFNLYFTALSLHFSLLVQLQVNLIFLGVFSAIYLIFNPKNIKFFILNLLLSFILFLSSNFYWVKGMLLNNFFTNSYSPKENVAWEVLRAHLEQYKGINNIDLLLLKGINLNSNYNIVFYISWYAFCVLLLVALSFLFIYLFKKIFATKKFKDNFALAILVTVFIVGYLQTISLTNIGINIFLLLAKYLYPLNGLRNYLNKVPVTYSLVILIVVFLFYLLNTKKSNITKTVSFAIVCVFSIFCLKILTNLNENRNNLTEGYKWPATFNQDFEELIQYLKNSKDTQRVVYFPQAEGNYTIVKDDSRQELYVGLSPIRAFSDIDDLNDMNILQGLGNSGKGGAVENFYEMEPEKILFKLNFLSINKIIINNTIDLSQRGYLGYPKTTKYEELYKKIKEDFTLVYETKNKEYSVYDINNIKIQFKRNLYNVKEPYLNFYSFDFNNNSFTTETLANNFFKYIQNNTDNLDYISESELGIYKDKFGNKVYLKEFSSDKNPQLVSVSEKIYTLDLKGDNILRILTKSTSIPYSIKVAVDSNGSSCLNKIFSVSAQCQIFKNIIPVKIKDGYIYTINTAGNSPQKMYVNIKSNFKNSNDNFYVEPKFLIGNSNLFKYNPFDKKSRDAYLENYFNVNNSATEYQIPKKFEFYKENKDTYLINLELSDEKLPIILVQRDFYNPKWILEGENIDKKIKFKSDTIFNGWIIFPKGNSKSMNLTIKFTDDYYPDITKKINTICILLCVVITIVYLVKNYKQRLIIKPSK